MTANPRSKKAMLLRGRSNVRWFAIFLFAALALWWLLTSFVIPDFWDPQYAMKLRSLKTCVAKMPGHPLWVVVGSSRVDHGLCPRVLADDMSRDHAPLIFNFGLSGADLFREFISLRRIVRDGVKPDRVGIELLGAMMGNNRTLFADEGELLVRARRDELADHRKYSIAPGAVTSAWWQSRLFPALRYGTQAPLQSVFLKFPGLRFLKGVGKMPPYDQWGWFVSPPPPPISPAAQAVLNENSRQPFEAGLKGKFQIAPLQKQIVERILEFCRQEKIEVFLLRTPESKYFQEIYTSEEKTTIDSYMTETAREHGVLFIDAHSWIGEGGFADGHHLNVYGAEEFTRKLAVELNKTAGKPDGTR